MEFIFYLLTGALTGLLSGLFGVGGGIIIVGMLTFIFHGLGFAETSIMHLALGTSLATIIPTSIASARAHHCKHNVDWPTFRIMVPSIIIGTLAGAGIAALLNSMWLKAIFSLFVILVAFKLLLSTPPSTTQGVESGLGQYHWQHHMAGIVIGVVSCLVGIGGGTLTVPYLNHCKFDIRRAIGTSAAIGLPIAIAGTAGFIFSGANTLGITLPNWSIGYIYLPAFAGIAVTSTLTAPYGAQLAQRLPMSTLKRLFALLLMAVGLRMLWSILG